MRSFLIGLLLSSALVAGVAALGGGGEVPQQQESPSKNTYFADDVPNGRVPW